MQEAKKGTFSYVLGISTSAEVDLGRCPKNPRAFEKARAKLFYLRQLPNPVKNFQSGIKWISLMQIRCIKDRNTSHKKTLRELVTSPQWDIGLAFVEKK